MLKISTLFLILTACIMAAALSVTASAQDDSGLKALEALDKALEGPKTPQPPCVSSAPASRAPSEGAPDTQAQPKLQAKDLEELKKASETAWYSGDMDTACEKSSVVIKIVPTALDFCKGRVHVINLVEGIEKELASGDYEKAKASLEQAKELCPKAKLVVDIERKFNVAQKLQPQGQEPRIQANAKDQEKSEKRKWYDEFDRRHALLSAGWAACRQKDLETCRKLLSEGLEGADSFFGNEYPGLVNPSKEMLAAVEKELAKKSAPKKPKK